MSAGTTRILTWTRILLKKPFFFKLGLLTTAQVLDCEVQECYSLTVIALDDGNPALFATQVLTIIVLDVNDETPVFLKQLYETAICENRDPGEFVVGVEAVVRDAGNLYPFACSCGPIQS